MFYFIAKRIHLDILSFAYTSGDDHLGCLQALAPMNICIKVFVWIYILISLG